MTKKLTSEKGFTLVETLIVLLVASILLMFPILSMGELIENVRIDLFFRELSSNLTLMQNHAILNNERTNVHFYPSESADQIQFQVVPRHALNRTMVLDRPYYHLHNEKRKSFRFQPGSGNISASNTITFNTSQGMYELTYLLGSGRYDIKKTSSK